MKCNNCNKNTSNPQFCSKSCSASYHNKIKPKRKKKDIYKNCLNCYNSISNKTSAQKYCNLQCCTEHRKKINIENYEQKNNFNGSSNLFIRNYLINKHGNFCMICKLNADNWYGNPITLIVDHIDGKSNNNNISNLRIICPNCDSQTSTFKARNKGNSSRDYYIVQKNRA